MAKQDEPEEVAPETRSYDYPPTPEIVTAPPPMMSTVMSVDALRFMLQDSNIPKGAKDLFWGFYSKFSALSNLSEQDINKLVADYDYCCDLYLMSRTQPKAVPKTRIDDNGKKVRVSPLKTIKDQFNEDLFLAEGRALIIMLLKRSKDALQLRLAAPHALPNSQMPIMPRQPGKWEKLTGKFTGRGEGGK